MAVCLHSIFISVRNTDCFHLMKWRLFKKSFASVMFLERTPTITALRSGYKHRVTTYNQKQDDMKIDAFLCADFRPLSKYFNDIVESEVHALQKAIQDEKNIRSSTVTTR